MVIDNLQNHTTDINGRCFGDMKRCSSLMFVRSWC